MSLRARLLVGMVILVTAGLAVAAIATYEEQRSFLLDRVDQQVLAASLPISGALGVDLGPGNPAQTTGADRAAGRLALAGSSRRTPSGRASPLLPSSGTFGELLGANGKVLRVLPIDYVETPAPAPKLPKHMLLTRLTGGHRLFTVDSVAGSSLRYRRRHSRPLAARS